MTKASKQQIEEFFTKLEHKIERDRESAKEFHQSAIDAIPSIIADEWFQVAKELNDSADKMEYTLHRMRVSYDKL